MIPQAPDKYVSPMWRDFNAGLAKDMYPDVPSNFMRNPNIEGTMHTRGAAYTPDRVEWLEKHFRCDFDFLARMLHETAVGEPYISVDRYRASDVTVGHLFHIAKYRQATGNDLPALGTILEWGGGYGNLARMVKMIHPQCTYVIIDTPIMSYIQNYYLNYFTPTVIYNGSIVKGMVNLVPLTEVDGLDMSADMFISTWALNESTDACGELLKSRQWYGAEQFLISYLRGSYNIDTIEGIGGKILDVDFLPPNKYMVK